MNDLTHIWKPGQSVKWHTESGLLEGKVKEVYSDHLIVNIPSVSDHCWFEEGFNLGDLYPDYNF